MNCFELNSQNGEKNEAFRRSGCDQESNNIKQVSGESSVESNQSKDSEEDITRLTGAMWPLFWSLRVSGLYYDRGWGAPSKVYVITLLVMLWCDFVRSTSVYRGDNDMDTALLQKSVLVGWKLLCCINASVLFYSASIKDNVCQFFKEWNRCMSNNLECRYRYIYRKSCQFVCFFWFVVTLNVVSSAVATFKSDFMDHNLAPCSRDSSYVFYMRVYSSIIQLWFSAAWVFPIALYLSMANLLYLLFKQVQEDLARKIEQPDIMSHLEDFRQSHKVVLHS